MKTYSIQWEKACVVVFLLAYFHFIPFSILFESTSSSRVRNILCFFLSLSATFTSATRRWFQLHTHTNTYSLSLLTQAFQANAIVHRLSFIRSWFMRFILVILARKLCVPIQNGFWFPWGHDFKLLSVCVCVCVCGSTVAFASSKIKPYILIFHLNHKNISISKMYYHTTMCI